MSSLKVRAAGGLPFVMGGLSFVVAAQATAQVAPGVVPTREELEGISRTDELPAPRLTIEGGVERSPCSLADPQYRDVTVTIRQVEFNGLKGASLAELEPAWMPFQGKEHPVAVLCEIRDAAATILRNKGYLAATQVPTQRIEDGVVTFEVLYGRISAVRARGETRGAEVKLQQYLGRLAEDEIFDRNQAERALLLARDLPGYTVNLTLRPAGGAPGDLIGEVTVEREKYAFDFAVQNYGADATGPVGGQLRAQFFGLTGMGDVTTLSYFTSSDFDEQQVFQASHEFRPGGSGLAVSAGATYAITKPDVGLAANLGVPVQDLEATTFFASLSASYPIKRTQGENLSLAGGFDYIDQDVDFIAPLSRDRIRVGWVKLAYDTIDLERRAPRYQASGTIEYRQGLDIFGANSVCIGAACPAGQINPGRLDGEPTSSVIRASANVELALTRTLALAFKPRAQWSLGGGLFGFEEFAAGNFSVGRGYDPGTIIGDSGFAMTTEARTATMPVSDTIAMQPYAFFDLAKIYNEAPDLDDDLYSVGAGARVSIDNRFSIDAMVAQPLKRAGLQTKRGSTRVLFTLTASF
ncbi:ShlB/FhaC/HecB family hemolysin secretion/activation protein [Erythrobacter sp. SCSIO 43205]|uniref:ShlB/FhaC/HecB family hemolysin secretion/activation protein n=1 Tax=Erythrobacter sp. SCSIO 43205 TaxID=2779361 RepID=UPI001CA80EC1|nr:ShlB/FhaC/HecB family hemolysin secretion/activation protein [Erythrobacter sp. SCSIO 43205]UAB78760.1 ShlB/FhaC/HecB family hemolysin secretion/activation protein [Erythrobacter sp. SCSIO 43205]